MVDRVNDTMTEDELVAILRAAAAAEPENEPNTITTREYIDASGLTEYKARRQLRALAESGVLKPDYIGRTNAWGDRQHIKGYRYAGGG